MGEPAFFEGERVKLRIPGGTFAIVLDAAGEAVILKTVPVGDIIEVDANEIEHA